LLGGEQPRVETKHLTFGQVLLNPLIRGFIDQMARGDERGIDLLSHLKRITAIDKNGGAVGKDDGHAPRAPEAGEPA
jgi:hypothetical protein